MPPHQHQANRYARHQKQQQQQQHSHHHADRYSSSLQSQSSHSPSNYHHHQQQQQSSPPQRSSSSSSPPPIFSARGVEWPLPTAFSPSQYRKWRRESRAAGAILGIANSGLRLESTSATDGSYGAGDAGGGVSAFAASPSPSTPASGGGGDGGSVGGGGSVSLENSTVVSAGGATNSTGNSSGGGGGGYGGLTGLMGRVLGASSPSAPGAGGGASLLNGIEEEDLANSATRPILPPRARCVAASNGWIVAVVECGLPPNIAFTTPTSSSSAHHHADPSSVQSTMMQQMPQSKHALTSLIPPLRLVSRWNVRRGTSLGSEGNHLVPLPPPVRPGSAEDGGPRNDVDGGGNDPNFGRIAHAFADPTGCHVLLSAKNGEAYYLHSTSRAVQKLEGFGPSGADGSYSGHKAGVTLGEAASLSGGDGEANVQVGLTPGSYVTAVGWDRDRGTEGSTKRILLGTSYGELYEYALLSPNATAAASSAGNGKGKSSPFDARAGELSTADDGDSSDPMDSPVLLRRLNATTGGQDHGGAVGGLLFRRIAGGIVSAAAKTPSRGGGGCAMIVLASTGGSHRHTRLHAFRSEPASGVAPTLRSAFSGVGRGGGSGSSFAELPGCVDFPELRGCSSSEAGMGGGSFALRTETGIYHGTVERCVVGMDAATDAGMLAYDGLRGGMGGGGRRAGGLPSPPASIGITPHHFITLSSTANDVMFVNRVAGKVVQEERVDWASVSQSTVPFASEGEEPSFSQHRHRGGVGPPGAVLPPSSSSPAAAAELLADVRRPDQIWLRRGRSLVHISSSCEDRDVWKFTLARCIESAPPPASGHVSPSAMGAAEGVVGGGVFPAAAAGAPLTSEEKQIEGRFEHAKSLCGNSSQKAVVNAVRAEYHLSQGRVELAAKYMAQCPPAVMPFADTAARLALPMIDGRCHGNNGDGDRGGSNNNGTIVSRVNSRGANEALGRSNMALIAFLSDKMKAVKAGGRQSSSVVCTLLGTWLTELHLQEREMGDDGGDDDRATGRRTGAGRGRKVNQALLHQFLSSFVRDMDSRSIVNVLASHDISAGECAGYSAAAGDIGAAVNAALSGEDEKNGALDALRVLNDSPIEKAEPYYYKYALTLLCRAPMSAAKSFVARYTEGLCDTKLLPSFMHYEQRRKSHAAARKVDPAATNTASSSSTFVDDENASIRYFEGVIKLGSRSRAIFNYLTSLYAGMDDEGPLFRFLSAHVPPATRSAASPVSIGGGSGNVGDLLLKQAEEEKKSPLDKSYALRTILRTGRHFRSAVKLYMGFGMRQQAVELALKVDPSLARELARRSEDKDEMKRLWLMIARNAAANETPASSSQDGRDVVARVVMVLKDCGPDILSIEDVLPFLPDFAQIDQFKDEICDALASYSSKIEHYLKEMNECDQTCDALRDELSRLKTVGTRVRADARCALTNKCILEQGEPFYAFPSGYVVLEAALKREVIPHLNEKQLGRVKFIEDELARLSRPRAGSGRSSYEVAKEDYQREELRSELDGLIAAECPLTGSVMVESIDHGFSGDEEDEFV